jgi:DNA topoisomerase-1
MPSDSAVVPRDPTRDPLQAARAAGLRYVSDCRPGIRRTGRFPKFRYRAPDGGRPDPETLERIRKLAIPPAWTDVWICLRADGHIQATGRDAKGRKQYRYHPAWREVRDGTKFERVIACAQAFPVLRARVEADLGRPGLPREKVLAAVVRLLELTLIRIGNDEYARSNQSYGLTTLRNEHVGVAGSEVRFEFRAKSGKIRSVTVRDRRLARIVRRCQELPGQELFEYVDEDGRRRDVESTDVNAYLREITGEDLTAKDFRTWGATVLAYEALCKVETPTKAALLAAIDAVAAELGNTRAVCRSSYIHPAIPEAFLEGTLATLPEAGAAPEPFGLTVAERAVLEMLRRPTATVSDERSPARNQRNREATRAVTKAAG